MKKKYSINNIGDLDFTFKVPSVVFLKGDLGTGKTTLVKHILNNIFGLKENISSPTYTYYNKYKINGQLKTIYHFDLYRLENYDEFFAIGGEDILDNNNGIIFIEWPELIEKYYSPDLEIILKKTKNQDEREIEISES